jgi:hypothetical protein
VEKVKTGGSLYFVGYSVRVNDSVDSTHAGDTGTVIEYQLYADGGKTYRVEFDGGKTSLYTHDELTLVERRDA